MNNPILWLIIAGAVFFGWGWLKEKANTLKQAAPSVLNDGSVSVDEIRDLIQQVSQPTAPVVKDPEPVVVARSVYTFEQAEALIRELSIDGELNPVTQRIIRLKCIPQEYRAGWQKMLQTQPSNN